ncbi:MAG: Na(+)/H(+) antiporter subunit B [Candidatus Binatia bacterium]|nr:Na(+)/H(+) antiporter subunit B [Candidatus Binatia bacterium]
MRSLILLTATRLLFPLMLLFSVFLLLRGHNAPGGGFVGGLVAGGALALHALAHGIVATRLMVGFSPVALISAGLTLAAMSGLVGWFWQKPYLTGVWGVVPVLGTVGTPLLFDLGVYVLVVGIVTHMLFLLWEE